MNPKMKSAIEKITLNDATFSNEVIEPTYVNFFYGKNGAGKSTIARTFKANDERLQWQAGKASTDYDVLVYDTDFINANLRNYGNLAGVFTVNETNIAIQEQVDTLNAERKKMGEEYNGHKAAIDQKTADKNTALSTFQSDCWSKSAEARTLFDEAIKGKKKAALFAQEILAITPVAHDVEDLKTLYGTVFSGDAQQYNMLSKAGKVDLELLLIHHEVSKHKILLHLLQHSYQHIIQAKIESFLHLLQLLDIQFFEQYVLPMQQIHYYKSSWFLRISQQAECK